MKLRIIILIFLLLTICRVYSQSSGIKKPEYRCWVFFYSNNVYSKLNAFIYSVSDSGIYFVPDHELKSGLPPHFISAEAIVEIKIRKIGQIGKGALAGGLMGIFAGAAIGYASGESNGCESIALCFDTAGDKALLGACISGGLGAGIGALSNHSNIHISINRNQNEFEKQKEKLSKYSITENKTVIL